MPQVHNTGPTARTYVLNFIVRIQTSKSMARSREWFPANRAALKVLIEDSL
ncbi:hypothetical protein EC91649_A0023 [Escherichia coli 9.1649]|uniref:Uncharacterized protein n=7 Tax=Gammaproteobacteria TaxID=1236 RepID=A0A1B2RBA9_ECOLX|nr:hypothetical protein Vcrx133 [Vibrio cholerae]AKJ18886.1 hypothetical protein [Citrobacter freundii]AOB41834.1 hypothetical protein [Escherichia coli]APD70578.1 hypothetical protein [Klebsiella pneumoniae]AVE22843.1 Hypothetical protein [Enterobacter hormaechei]KKA59053.1 hypothetical protein EC91649_A0023 [Escherichia coli 9.1649]QNI18157.1 hypothetical protein [Escherichia coli N1]QNL33787.1 hypothetical protein [Salmonella enterica]CCG28740.1 hypothetical protein [Klebsiella aerogenes